MASDLARVYVCTRAGTARIPRARACGIVYGKPAAAAGCNGGSPTKWFKRIRAEKGVLFEKILPLCAARVPSESNSSAINELCTRNKTRGFYFDFLRASRTVGTRVHLNNTKCQYVEICHTILSSDSAARIWQYYYCGVRVCVCVLYHNNRSRRSKLLVFTIYWTLTALCGWIFTIFMVNILLRWARNDRHCVTL